MSLPYAEPLVTREPAPRRIPEPPRRGEPGGPPCGICGGKTTHALWSDDNWTLHAPVGGSLPGAVWIASREHFDSFADMKFELKSRFAAADGKRGAMEWVWSGRQTKDFPGLPATNKPFQVRGAVQSTPGAQQYRVRSDAGRVDAVAPQYLRRGQPDRAGVAAPALTEPQAGVL